MTVGMAHSLVTRALHVTKQRYDYAGNDGEGQIYELQQWAAILVFATIGLYLAVLSMVSRLATPCKANDQQG